MAVVVAPVNQSGAVGQAVSFTCTVDNNWTIDGWDISTDGGTNWSVLSTGITGNAVTSTYSRVIASGESGYQFRCYGTQDDELTGWSSAASLNILTVETGTVVDAGFENGVDGAVLNSGAWITNGSPQIKEYDSEEQKIGNQSAKIMGGVGALAGIQQTASGGMTSDNAEIRFWVKLPSSIPSTMYIDDIGTPRTLQIRVSPGGNLDIYTQRTGVTGYTANAQNAVGTWTAGWVQYRIVYHFSTDSWNLYSRTQIGSAWTRHKSSGALDYEIPLYATGDITTNQGLLFRIYDSTTIWVDDLRYSNSGITEVEAIAVAITTHPVSQSKMTGETLTLAAAATGLPTPTAQWQCSTDGGSNYVDIPGATSSTYDHTVAVTENNYKYRCVFANDYGNSTTNVATLTLGVTSSVVQIMEANAEVTEASLGAPTYYVWGDNLEATYLDSGSPTTYFGGDSVIKMGATATDREYHTLIKYFEGALPKGVVSSAGLYLYTTPTGTCDLRAYPLKNYGDTAGAGWSGVRTGWSNQPRGVAPSWNVRMRDWQTGGTGTDRAWLTPGATDTNEIDISSYSSLSIASGGGSAYRSFDIGATQVNLWLGDTYSQGVLIKHNAGTGDRYASFPAPGQPNGPVLVVSYSSIEINQILGRKLSTDTYNNYAVFPIQGRCSSSALENGYMAINWTNMDLNTSTAIVSPEGRIRRVVVNSAPPVGYLHYNIMNALSYDPTHHRYWLLSDNGSDSKLSIAYSDEYHPTNWTWIVHPTIVTAKSSMVVVAGVVHGFVLDTADSDKLKYLTYTLSTDTWSSATDVVTKGVSTERALVTQILLGDVMNGAGTIYTDGSLVDFPDAGNLLIDSECFRYTGKSGNNFTGVTRATQGTAAAAHTTAWSSVSSTGVKTPRLLTTQILIDDVMDGAGVIYADNSISEFPEFGNLIIENEHFWYTGKSGNNFTGVTRATHGTTAATHAVGSLIDSSIGIPTYSSISWDATRQCFHVTWSHNRFRGPVSTYEYQSVGYLRHYISDSVTTWKDYNDNIITLPVNPSNVKFVSEPDMLAYPLSMVCTAQGNLIMPNQKMAVRGGARTGEDIAYQNYGSSGISHTDASMMYVALVDLGASNVAAVSVTGTTQGIATSADAGATFSAVSTISTHSYPARSNSNNGVSADSLVGGLGLAYFQHSTAHGAVYLNAIEMAVLAPTSLIATFSVDQVNLSWTDNSGIEEGFYIERRYKTSGDWTAYEACVGSPVVADTQNLTDSSLPVGCRSLQYRVAAYKGTQTSSWVESEVLITAVFIPQIVIY
ncbi:DNRLRE domain-containing protein [Candidatus Saccharibacteria bacterium]|nr:DNRLRE domain-containing protein [Candidatus Saccharibacteria bacterium]